MDRLLRLYGPWTDVHSRLVHSVHFCQRAHLLVNYSQGWTLPSSFKLQLFNVQHLANLPGIMYSLRGPDSECTANFTSNNTSNNIVMGFFL